MSIKAPLPYNIDPNLYQTLTIILHKAVDSTQASDFFLLSDADGSSFICKVEAVRDAATGNWTLQLSDF